MWKIFSLFEFHTLCKISKLNEQDKFLNILTHHDHPANHGHRSKEFPHCLIIYLLTKFWAFASSWMTTTTLTDPTMPHLSLFLFPYCLKMGIFIHDNIPLGLESCHWPDTKVIDLVHMFSSVKMRIHRICVIICRIILVSLDAG